MREQGTEFHFVAITPPQTRKRKAAEDPEDCPISKKQANHNRVPNAALPTTPLTNMSTPPPMMDSDDEFMSGVSSQEDAFGNVEESDDGSLGTS